MDSGVAPDFEPGVVLSGASVSSCKKAVVTVSLLVSTGAIRKWYCKGNRHLTTSLKKIVASPCVSTASEYSCPHTNLVQLHLYAETMPNMCLSHSLIKDT